MHSKALDQTPEEAVSLDLHRSGSRMFDDR